MIRKDCPECDGTGWKPVEKDEVRYVVRCGCRQTERTRQLLEQSRIPRRYEHCAFENFDIRRHLETGQPSKSLEYARLTANTFVEEYPLDYGLLFVGPTGVGKTHLAVAVLRELITTKSAECLFYDFRELTPIDRANCRVGVRAPEYPESFRRRRAQISETRPFVEAIVMPDLLRRVLPSAIHCAVGESAPRATFKLVL